VTSLPVLPGQGDCWNRIGVQGDRSCPELARVLHCHNCPVFAAAGRRFLDTPSPDGYLDEWTERLARPLEEAATDLQSVLLFRLGDEWLALPVDVLVEVTTPRPVHRVPHRGGLLAGLVNVRGELYLCVRLDRLLGIHRKEEGGRPKEESANGRPADPSLGSRLLLVRREADRWVFPVDEVAQVYRFPAAALTRAPATVARASSRLTRGVLAWKGRSVGCLDEGWLFQALRARVQ
jgi:chemotaxis-related protein WspD